MGSATKKSAAISSERKIWDTIYNALIHTLRKQQAQLESLLEQRNLLEQRIKIQYDHWASNVLLLEDETSQMRRQMSLAEFARLVESLKANLVVGSKERHAFVYKNKLEHAESELDDLKAWFDILSHRCPDQENISLDRLYESLKAKCGRERFSKKASTHHCKTLEMQVVMLKREYEKLSLKNSSEVSALQAEISFVWNQYKEMERNYTNKLQTKSYEINRANDRITKLLSSTEQLQSSNTEKEETVETLRANITKLEADVNQKDGEISRLSKELEFLRSKSSAGTPFLKRCTSEPSTSRSTSRGNGRSRGIASMKEKASSEQLVYEQDDKRSKRKRDDVVTIDETPKFFTSQFKVPKSKRQSPRGR